MNTDIINHDTRTDSAHVLDKQPVSISSQTSPPFLPFSPSTHSTLPLNNTLPIHNTSHPTTQPLHNTALSLQNNPLPLHNTALQNTLQNSALHLQKNTLQTLIEHPSIETCIIDDLERKRHSDKNIHKVVSFNDNLTIHSHEDWTRKLKIHRQEKQSRKQSFPKWNDIRVNIVRVLSSCSPRKRHLKLDDLESDSFLNNDE
jgi:hypothetical protein